MKRFILILAAVASLSACTTPGGLSVPAAPAPLAGTTADDTALEAAWRSFDVALDALNVLADTGVIKPGSPTAKRIAAGVRKVNGALQAAEHFAAAGSTASYKTALEEAKAAFLDMRAALKER